MEGSEQRPAHGRVVDKALAVLLRVLGWYSVVLFYFIFLLVFHSSSPNALKVLFPRSALSGTDYSRFWLHLANLPGAEAVRTPQPSPSPRSLRALGAP